VLSGVFFEDWRREDEEGWLEESATDIAARKRNRKPINDARTH
jgi:hypothetical protein